MLQQIWSVWKPSYRFWRPGSRHMLLLGWTAMLIAMSVEGAEVRCPEECDCRVGFDPEEGAALRVACARGGMHAVPVDYLDRGAHVIIITAPIDQPNFLTIGPIFTQPTPFANLRELHIVNSNVPSIGQYSFWGLQNLRLLNLTYNNLTGIGADNFRGLINLTDLHLDHNNIEQMPSETFRHLTSLRTLILSHNKISSLVPRLFRMLAKLSYLDLSDNPLADLNPENKLQTLSEQDLQRLEAIAQINLSKNTWHCDQCSVGTMLIYMTTTVLNGTLRNAKCYSPMRLHGVKFGDLSYDRLDGCPSTHEAQMSVIAGLMLLCVAVLAAVAGALCCTRRRAAHYYTNEEKRRERDHDHPEELLGRTELGSVATIHAPYHLVTKGS
ncbi:leucine-rich repeat-containing protein 15-like [Pectinophora gossypiella]|uniref:leucine-rich repeat-containing protein 15-like n=1 Tax=Pectinophora gossypiella TaxID=13191 RepID=UPI00214E71C3|nr:leucine-rich repeat-containing protein 15-like [Pectinophora gossypiella]